MTVYDVRLKFLLRAGARVFFDHLNVAGPHEPIDTDLSRDRGRRVDYLARTPGGGVVHLEVQSSPDASVPLRMLEYYVDILRSHGGQRRLDYQKLIEDLNIRQIVIFLREIPRKDPKLIGRGALAYVYRHLSILDFPGAAMRQSHDLGDVVLSYLTRGGDRRDLVGETLRRIMELCENGTVGKEARDYGIATLAIFSGLRGGQSIFNSELSQMEMDIDLAKVEIIAEYAEARERQNLVDEIEDAIKEIGDKSTWDDRIEAELLMRTSSALRKILRKIDRHPIKDLLFPAAEDRSSFEP